MKQIKHIQCGGNWSPLLKRLGGWHPSGDDSYSNGQEVFDFNQVATAPIFYISEDELSARFSISPSRLTISHELSSGSLKAEGIEYILNHAAVTVEDLDAEEIFWKETLGVKPIIRTNDAWDPIVNGPLNTTHFYKPGSFYLTLRKEEPAGKVHHIGWETRTKDLVLSAKRVLQEIKWPIFWEGDIDGSYVVHFKGPDGRIHDFFCPSQRLRT